MLKVLAHPDTRQTTADAMGFFEAIYTQRALLYLKPDPVPDELIKQVIDAGIQAPNGGSEERWVFIVIKNPEVKRKMAPLYRKVGLSAHGEHESASARRAADSADYLSRHAAEVPVWILANLKNPGTDIHKDASIYPAVQNMLLAARAPGLGSVLTTRVRRRYEREIKEWLGIPDGWATAAMIALVWPQESHHYGPTTRRPAWEDTPWERWGNQQPQG